VRRKVSVGMALLGIARMTRIFFKKIDMVIHQEECNTPPPPDPADPATDRKSFPKFAELSVRIPQAHVKAGTVANIAENTYERSVVSRQLSCPV
jgi:hypothetical protein